MKEFLIKVVFDFAMFLSNILKHIPILRELHIIPVSSESLADLIYQARKFQRLYIDSESSHAITRGQLDFQLQLMRGLNEDLIKEYEKIAAEVQELRKNKKLPK